MSVEDLDSFEFDMTLFGDNDEDGFSETASQIATPPSLFEILINSGKFTTKQLEELNKIVQTRRQPEVRDLRDKMMKYVETVNADSSNIDEKKENLAENIKQTLFPQKKGGRKKKRKTRRKSRRKRKRKTRRKSKNKTRRKSGRGIGPSKIAKVGVAALAASSVIGQGMGHGISPSRGTPAAVNHFNTVACSDFHIRDIVEHSEDHGQPTKHYRQVLKAALKKKRTCKRMGKPMRNPNTGQPMSNPNRGQPMSKKKQNQANKRRKARAKEKAKTRSKKSDTKNGRQGKKAKEKSRLGDIAAGVGLVVPIAAMVLGDRQRGRDRYRNRNRPPRALTPPRQRYG